MTWVLNLFMNKKLISIGIILIIIGLVSVYIASLKFEISSLESDKNELNTQLVECMSKIKEITTSKEDMEKQLKKLKDMRPKIKYRTIEKIREVKSDACEQTKNVLTEVRKLNFDDL